MKNIVRYLINLALHNCIRPPHFPPHCGCPAYAPKEK